MATHGGSRSSASGSNSSLILGILIGMVLGLAIAGGVAWHIAKQPSPFLNKEGRDVLPADQANPAAPATQAAPAPGATGSDGKPRFEFYKILTDKDSATPRGAGTSTATVPNISIQPSTQSKTPALGISYFLQAGSFSTASDADKLKAKLAMLGMEASVQTADVAGKGTRYRVRLGPYRNASELSQANNTLKENGINDAAQVRAQ